MSHTSLLSGILWSLPTLVAVPGWRVGRRAPTRLGQGSGTNRSTVRVAPGWREQWPRHTGHAFERGRDRRPRRPLDRDSSRPTIVSARSRSSSVTRTHPGSGVRMRTPMGCFVSTFRGQRPQRSHRCRPRLGGPRTQWPTAQTTSVQETDRTDRRAPVAL